MFTCRRCSGRGRPATDCSPPGVSVKQICVETYSTPLPTNARKRSHDSPKINPEPYKLFRHRERGGMVQATKSHRIFSCANPKSGVWRPHRLFFLTCKWGLHRALMTTELIWCDLYFKLKSSSLWFKYDPTTIHVWHMYSPCVIHVWSMHKTCMI